MILDKKLIADKKGLQEVRRVIVMLDVARPVFLTYGLPFTIPAQMNDVESELGHVSTG